MQSTGINPILLTSGQTFPPYFVGSLEFSSECKNVYSYIWHFVAESLIKFCITIGFREYSLEIHPSIHVWRYSPFRALASLKRRLQSSLFSVLLLHPLNPSSCDASLWTTSTHLVLRLPAGLVAWTFPFKTFFGILLFFHSYYMARPF